MLVLVKLIHINVHQEISSNRLVINLGIAKTGTTSLAMYFKCNNWSVAHDMNCGSSQRCSDGVIDFLQNFQKRNFISSMQLSPQEHAFDKSRLHGHEAMSNMAASNIEFKSYVGNHEVMAEINDAYHCIFPQVIFLHQLIASVPNACFILTTRPVEHWMQSVSSYVGDIGLGYLADAMLRSCPIQPRNKTGLRIWYLNHMQRARQALQEVDCSVEIDIESSNAGSMLQKVFPESDASCWGHYNEN